MVAHEPATFPKLFNVTTVFRHSQRDAMGGENKLNVIAVRRPELGNGISGSFRYRFDKAGMIEEDANLIHGRWSATYGLLASHDVFTILPTT